MKNSIVIKIGGLASQQLSQSCVKQIKQWHKEGKQIVVVHGGGFAIDKLMAEQHLSVEKIDGLRVTSKDVMKLVEYSLFQIVGPSITSSLNNAGCDSIQIKSSLGKIIEADYLNQEKYGFVGQITKVHTQPLEAIMSEGMIPVIGSMGVCDEQLLNINADYVATAIAVALKAERLILMTDVPGVKEDGTILPTLNTTQIEEKIQSGVITGGMIPKIKGASQTVQAGVETVLISDNLSRGTLICLA